MNSHHSVTFLATGWTIVLSVVVVAVTATFSYLAWRRSGYLRSVARLELLRLTIVILAAVVLNQPEWVEEYRPDEKPAIAVLHRDRRL